MPQASVIARPKQIPSAEINLGGTSTSKKAFLDNSGAVLVCPFPSGGQLSSNTLKQMSIFKVVLGGRVTGGTTTNFTPSLQYGTSATVASNTDILTGAAVAVNSVSGLWMIEAVCMVDYTSKKIDSSITIQKVSGSTVTLTAAATGTNVITSVSADVGTALGFVAACTFSAGNAGNVAYVDVFQVEMVG